MTTKCHQCGSITNSGDMFCTNCGYKLEPLTTGPNPVDEDPKDHLNSTSSFSIVIANVIYILIIKLFILPIQIVKNSYHILSEYSTSKSNNKVLSRDFPIYSWIIYIFDCWIVLAYPIGGISIIYSLITFEKEERSIDALFYQLILSYFFPIIYSLIKEWLQIILIALHKLYVIADRHSTY